MLKIIEYSLLAGTLLVVIALVVSGSRSGSQSAPPEDSALPKDNPEARQPGKSG